MKECVSLSVLPNEYAKSDAMPSCDCARKVIIRVAAFQVKWD